MEETDRSSGKPTETAPTTGLPRSAWSSQLAQLRNILKTKQALDRQENSLNTQSPQNIDTSF
ncbi:MAG: hypothetical protein DCF21_04750 [Leptolyngbya sp.]|nr:MAG: hypothetical protein DCF21_04750 [Leptolyngbya sp.]